MLGSPVRHSLSPLLHRAAYAALGLDWRYEAVDVDAAALAGFVAGLGPEWVGLSLTRPLKEAVLDLADEADPMATRVGAANTLLLRRPRVALNTDVGGLRAVFGAHGLSGPVRVAVLGAGATARSALVALDGIAADAVVVAREPARVADPAFLRLSYPVGVVAQHDDAARREALGRPLVVNTTPAGAMDGIAAEVDLLGLGSCGRGSGPVGQAYLDVGYDPWPTPLAAAYRAAGRVVGGGLDLLVRQAALQVEAMTGHPAPLAAMWAAVSVHGGRPLDG